MAEGSGIEASNRALSRTVVALSPLPAAWYRTKSVAVSECRNAATSSSRSVVQVITGTLGNHSPLRSTTASMRRVWLAIRILGTNRCDAQCCSAGDSAVTSTRGAAYRCLAKRTDRRPHQHSFGSINPLVINGGPSVESLTAPTKPWYRSGNRRRSWRCPDRVRRVREPMAVSAIEPADGAGMAIEDWDSSSGPYDRRTSPWSPPPPTPLPTLAHWHRTSASATTTCTAVCLRASLRIAAMSAATASGTASSTTAAPARPIGVARTGGGGPLVWPAPETRATASRWLHRQLGWRQGGVAFYGVDGLLPQFIDTPRRVRSTSTPVQADARAR